MEIKIVETIKKEKSIYIKTPYYFKANHKIDDRRVDYGKITENNQFMISEWGNFQYEISIINESIDSWIFDPKYKSTKKEFEAVKKRAIEFMKREGIVEE